MPEEQRDTPPGKPQPLVEGIDFTIDSLGRYVFTSHYLLKRGTCCGSKCRNCPYEWKNVPPVRAGPSPTRRIEGERMPPLDD